MTCSSISANARSHVIHEIGKRESQRSFGGDKEALKAREVTAVIDSSRRRQHPIALVGQHCLNH